MDYKEYISKGIAFFREGKIDLALENLETALKLQPNNVDLQHMVEQLKMQAEYQQKQAESCIKEARSRADVMEGLYGIKLEEITDVDKIIAEYTQAPKCNHDLAKEILASAYYISGLIFDSKREYDEAVKAYSEAINNNPNYRLAFKRRGSANLKIGKIENCNQAIEDFKKANLDDVKLKRQLADTYWKRATVYDQKSDYVNVIADCERILELDPDDSNARELLDMAKEAMHK